MRTRITIEADEPCLVLVLPLPMPRRVEPKRAPRRVIETTGESMPDSRPSVAKVATVHPLRRTGTR